MDGQPGQRARGAARSSRGPGSPVPHSRPPAQRWRLTFARERDPDRRTHRDVADEWVIRLKDSGLPLMEPSGRFRVPLTFAAPLPAGMECGKELADLWLREPVPMWRAREGIAPTLPRHVFLLRLDDVWVGSPALAASLRAADYKVAVPDGAPVDDIEVAAAQLLASPTIERPRARGAGTVNVDVRPLIEYVGIARERACLEIRTRFLPDRGAGRPEDVLGILDSWVGTPIEWGETVRERLILAS